MASIWDEPDLQSNDDYVKFDNVGDTISGTIVNVRVHRFDDGKAVPQILVTTDNGEEKTITAGQVRLKAALAEKRPENGDRISVTLVDVEKRSGGKTLKHFDVVVTPHSNGTPVPAPTVDPAVAAAAVAAMSPQQRAELGI